MIRPPPISTLFPYTTLFRSLASFDLGDTPALKHVAVKEAVFPFARFPGVDIILGPEMKSTGEVMGLDDTFAKAFAKAQMGAGVKLPTTGTAFISVKESATVGIGDGAQSLVAHGFKLIATSGTADHLSGHGSDVKKVNKVLEGRPHCVDAILSDEVQLVVNTTEGAQAIADSFSIRRSALTNNVPHYTTMAGAWAAAHAIKALKSGALDVKPLQDYPNRAL